MSDKRYSRVGVIYISQVRLSLSIFRSPTLININYCLLETVLPRN